MNTWLIIGGVIVALIVIAAATVLLIGSTLPANHTVSRSIILNRPAPEVYAVVRDFAASAEWRPGVKSVDVKTDENGVVRIREDGADGVINFELLEDVPGRRLVTRITDKDLGFGGSWTYDFVPQEGATLVTITENGEVTNIFFRFMSRYVFGHTATIDKYLAALSARFGESVKS